VRICRVWNSNILCWWDKQYRDAGSYWRDPSQPSGVLFWCHFPRCSVTFSYHVPLIVSDSTKWCQLVGRLQVVLFIFKFKTLHWLHNDNVELIGILESHFSHTSFYVLSHSRSVCRNCRCFLSRVRQWCHAWVVSSLHAALPSTVSSTVSFTSYQSSAIGVVVVFIRCSPMQVEWSCLV